MTPRLVAASPCPQPIDSKTSKHGRTRGKPDYAGVGRRRQGNPRLAPAVRVLVSPLFGDGALQFRDAGCGRTSFVQNLRSIEQIFPANRVEEPQVLAMQAKVQTEGFAMHGQRSIGRFVSGNRFVGTPDEPIARKCRMHEVRVRVV